MISRRCSTGIINTCMSRCAPTIGALLSMVVLFAAPVTARKLALPPHPATLSYPALNWQVPQARQNRSVLDCGAILYLAVDHTVPIVTISGSVRGGSLVDPAGKEGRAELMAQMMRSGGTRSFPPDTIDMLLDLYAINATLRANETDISFSFSFLSEYTDTALFVIGEILSCPVFDSLRFEKERSIALEDARHRYDTPGPVLSAAQTAQLYPGQPNRTPATESSLHAVSRHDLAAAHSQAFVGKNCIVGASGDFDHDRIATWYKSLFAKLPDSPATPFPAISYAPSTRMLLVHKPITQAYVRMSLPLFQRPHADFFATSLLDMILGGASFSSRLNEKIRSNAGLTYSIYSQAVSNYFYPAPFYIQFHTKTETAVQALGMARAEVSAIAANGVTADELAHAKKVLVDGLPSMFRGADALVTHYIRNEYQGRDLDYYRHYADSVNSITLEDVARVARIYADTAKIAYTIVADTTTLFATDTSSFFSIRSYAPRAVIGQDSLDNWNGNSNR